MIFLPRHTCSTAHLNLELELEEEGYIYFQPVVLFKLVSCSNNKPMVVAMAEA
jgi:hypothetical protein